MYDHDLALNNLQGLIKSNHPNYSLANYVCPFDWTTK